jgi:hypothetical protein
MLRLIIGKWRRPIRYLYLVCQHRSRWLNAATLTFRRHSPRGPIPPHSGTRLTQAKTPRTEHTKPNRDVGGTRTKQRARCAQHQGTSTVAIEPVSTESRERATVDEGSDSPDLKRRQLPRWMRIRAQALRLPNDDLARLGEAITLEQRRRRRGGPVPVEPPVGAPIATADPPPPSDGVAGRSDEQGGSGACRWPRPLPRPRLAEDIARLHRPARSDPSPGQRRSRSGAQAEKAHSPRRTSATSENHRSSEDSPAPSPTFSPPQQPHRATAMPSLNMPTLRLLPVIDLRLGRLSDGVDVEGAHPGVRRRASATRPSPTTAPRPGAARPTAP